MKYEQARPFDEWADSYDRSVQDEHAFPFTGYSAVLNRVVDLAAAAAGLHVLDLGIGTGNLARRFVDLGCDVSGIDFSPKMLALAQAKLPGVHLAEADMAGAWPAGLRDHFDRIVSAYTFHHLDLPEKTALVRRLIERHLSPGGFVVVGDICFATDESLAAARISAGGLWDDSEYYWVVPRTIEACEAVGLSALYSPVSDCGGVFVFRRGGEQ